jgi:cytochrome c-type biogenesis protein CcmF
MYAEVGYGILVITFIVALYSVGAAIYGSWKKMDTVIESARRAMLLTWPLITLSAACLIYLLVTNHFEVSFVYEVTSLEMPTYLKVTAWWGGQSGSLVFWSWLMSSFASLVALRKWDRDREFLPWVIVVTSITTAFFIGLVIFYENPFSHFWYQADGKLYVDAAGNAIKSLFPPMANMTMAIPTNGNGLNPLLRHPGMIIHPPMLYLGFVSFVIPYAFAMAALITGRTDDRWIRITRRWTLVAWLFLSCGLVLGSRWAYDVLGWGGFWGWDPVEIAAFMPWLTGTAFLHSVMIQEKRGLFKYWNMILIILTYALVIFGTFLTRSGVLSSVHAFAQSAIGPAFFTFIGITFVTSIALVIYRWPELRSETEMKSMLSREALFLLNNLLFMSVLVVCFWGVIFPLISELVTGQKVTVGPPFYLRATGPLFAGLMLLMGIAPLSAWGHSTFKTLGRAVWKSALAALAITVIIFFTYTKNVIALIGFLLIAFVLLVTIIEFWRATLARMKTQNENFFVSLWTLIGRNRRRYGGYIIHISMMLMAIGILGINVFQVDTQKSLSQGQSIDIGGYTLRFDDLKQFDHTVNGVVERNVNRAEIGLFQNGKFVTELYPRYDVYPNGQPMTIPGLYSTLGGDVYVILVNWESASASLAPFKVFINPLVNWLWIGSILFIFGILIAAWPDRDVEVVPATARRESQTSAAD